MVLPYYSWRILLYSYFENSPIFALFISSRVTKRQMTIWKGKNPVPVWAFLLQYWDPWQSNYYQQGNQMFMSLMRATGHPTMLGHQRCIQMSQPLVLFHVKWHRSNSNSVTWDVVSEFEAIVVRGSSTLARPCLFSGTGSQLLMLFHAML